MSTLDLEFPTTASGFLSEEDHENIDSLVHNLAETGFVEIVRNSDNKVTNVNSRVSDGGTLVRSTSITRNSEGKVSAVTENQHDENGSIVQTIQTTINRQDGKVVSINVMEVV